MEYVDVKQKKRASTAIRKESCDMKIPETGPQGERGWCLGYLEQEQEKA